MNFEVLPEPSPIEGEANRLLFDKVRRLVAGIPRSKVHLLALLITPEDGVKLVTRGALSARLREAGLDAEAHAAIHLARNDAKALVCWGEAGDDVDASEVGFHVLRLRRCRM